MDTAIENKQGMEWLPLDGSKIRKLHLWDIGTFGLILNLVFFPLWVVWNCWKRMTFHIAPKLKERI